MRFIALNKASRRLSPHPEQQGNLLGQSYTLIKNGTVIDERVPNRFQQTFWFEATHCRRRADAASHCSTDASITEIGGRLPGDAGHDR